MLKALAFVSTIARTSQAEDPAALKSRGDKAMDEGRAAEALDAYRQAMASAPSPSLDYNIGRALLATGDFVGALGAFERYEETAAEELKRKTHRLAEVMSELRTKIVAIEITGDAGASVAMDGKHACTLPCPTLRRNPGFVEVRVDAEERRPWVERRELVAGDRARFEAKLERIPVEATLVVATHPASAKVFVDGRFLGASPVSLALAPGLHEVEAKAPSFEARRTTLSLARSETRRLDLDLEPEHRAITTRWWFWTGIVAAIGGGTIAAIALTTERPERSGSLGTFQVP